MNNSKTKKILLTVIGVILSLGFLGGFTYAWFNTTISGSGAQATVTTANLGNTVVSGVNITTPTGVLPGWVSNDGTITITNDEIDEEASVEYTCYVKKNNNNIKDLQYRISADNAISSVGGQWTDITRGGRQGIVSGTLTGNNRSDTYKIAIKFKETGSNQNVQQGMSSIITFECDLSGLKAYEIIAGSYPADAQSEYTGANGLNYSEISSQTNGQGVYYTEGEEGKPIYFFRGGDYCANLSSTTKSACETAGSEWLELKNNIILGNNCYEIIRTNEDGSIRAIYNGAPTSGQCTATGSGTRISGTSSAFNNTTTIDGTEYIIQSDVTGVGYMFADPVGKTYQDGAGRAYAFNYNITSAMKVSTGMTMNTSTGLYTLTGTVNTAGNVTPSASGYKYTCRTTGTTCYGMYEIVTVSGSGAPYTMTSGIKHTGYYTTSKEEAQSNDRSSNVKTAVDAWYVTNIENNNLSGYLSDAGFCGDRSFGSSYLGYGRDEMYFNVRSRLTSATKTPTYACENGKVDLYTVENEKGNTALTYKVGMITADEYIMSGNGYSPTANTRNYLNKGYSYWTISPCYFNITHLSGFIFFVSSSSYLYVTPVYDSLYARPVINISNDVSVTGEGTKTNPYVVDVS